MKFKKLNTNWNAEPNAPNLQIEEGEDYLELIFDINTFQFDYLDEGDKGAIEFVEVFRYFIGTTNADGYLKGEHRYSNEQLPWGEFYELLESNWRTEFPQNSEIINPNLDKSELRHFIIFFRDQEVECLANDCFFSLRFKDEELYREKYPNDYFDHYIAMFAANQPNTDVSNFSDQIELYLNFEGKDEFRELQNEVNQIMKNEDYKWFLKQAMADEIPNINLDKLRAMMNSIIDFKL